MVKNVKGKEIPEIISDQCIGCQLCVGECPLSAIDIGPDGVAHIDPAACVGCGKCSQTCPVEAIRFEARKSPKPKPPKAAKEDEAAPGRAEGIAGYSGVAVFIEVFDGVGAQVSWELVGKARELAAVLGTKVIGMVLGDHVESVAKEAIAYGCADVHIIEHPLLRRYVSAAYGKALADMCEEVRPEILLIGATHLGRDLAGIVASRLHTGLTADCTGLSIEADTRLLLMTRPTFGGNIMATIFCERHRPQMSTVRPQVMRVADRDPGREGSIHRHEWTAPDEALLPVIIDYIKQVPELGSVDITRAPALVVAGRGACDATSVPLLHELAELVGGVVACSRPVVESGLMPYERQVGQTGKTVAPKLYIGVGVSGAIQHLVAIQGAEKIIAINSDPNAPIFRVADVGIVGDYLKVLPVMIEQLKLRLGRAA